MLRIFREPRIVVIGRYGRPKGHSYIGILAHQRGDSEAGVRLTNRSIELQPDNVDWMNDLGNVRTPPAAPWIDPIGCSYSVDSREQD